MERTVLAPWGELWTGDCRHVLATFPADSIHAIVTDPPYEIAMMNQNWDRTGVAFDPATWRAAYRVLRPGGYLLAFGSARTYHRLATAIEDAGFALRDAVAWIHAQGMAKSLDVGKYFDKQAGAERPVVGQYQPPGGGEWRLAQASDPAAGAAPGSFTASGRRTLAITAPVTAAAQRWHGWGTAVKPELELIAVARKPLGEATIPANLERWGTGGLNLGAVRLPRESGDRTDYGVDGDEAQTTGQSGIYGTYNDRGAYVPHPDGRLFGNVCIDDAVAGELDGEGEWRSRYFYCAKATRAERDAGCGRNPHITVKPLALMEKLVRLTCLPGGLVLDPFMGSGSTGCAAVPAGMRFIGIDCDPANVALATARIAHWAGEGRR